MTGPGHRVYGRGMSEAGHEILSAEQVGAILGRTARTVRRLADARAIPSEKLPGLNGPYIFRRADVDAYLARVPGMERTRVRRPRRT